jgi:hypothetical protein
MEEYKKESRHKQLVYFYLGLVATLAYRVIIVLNFFEPIWVKVAWYIGTIGFIFYFWSRYKVVRKFSSLIHEKNLVSAIDRAKNISKPQRQALAYIIQTLDTTKAQLNYVMIFVFSAIALVVGIILDFVV